jgi:hypothetical protein
VRGKQREERRGDMSILRLPFFDELDGARRVLVAGAGGGYDVFCGLPLYFGLREAGKEVHLANLSFSNLPVAPESRLAPSLVKVTAGAPLRTNYFPELFLARWFRERGEEVPIYCFERTGARPLLEGYRVLVDELGVDTLLLVDGGTDSLMCGDEVGLGTPHEDIASIAAADDLALERKLLACIGFGVDYYHGVCHAHFLEAVAELTKAGAYLGAFSLTEDMPEARQFRWAAEYVFAAMPHHPSIVSTSILSALAGEYGNVHATSRTAGSTLWINPLMPVYWTFRLDAVARRVLYLDEMKATEDYGDVLRVVERFRSRLATTRPWQNMMA